ncbi:MAG: hypothetical protein SOY50_01110 [Ruminococcus callidus]|nr:hypothetical protein [Ruminococcus callidus]
MSKRITYKDYKRRFDKLIESKGGVYDSKTKKFKPIPYADIKNWRQCYDKDTALRRNFPTYLFISNRGHLVSVHSKNKPIMVQKDMSSTSGRPYYRFRIKGSKKYKKFTVSNMVAICFGSETFGKADEIMEQYGINAFSKGDLQGHHENGYKEGQNAANNNPKDIELLTKPIHGLFQKVPNEGASADKEIKFMRELSKNVSEETDKHTILIPNYGENKGTGYIQNLPENAKIRLTKDASIDSIIYYKIDEWISSVKEADYFEKPRLVTTLINNQVRHYTVQNHKNKDKSNEGYEIEEITFDDAEKDFQGISDYSIEL